ncbi:MAG: ogr/Delta-like zinc finger family protein [Candidatus Bathyarchaeota archaeon]|nr:ogr/Delta-like zinc finger family protein [Candidatus Bathyarchaeota archaeon]
MNSIECAEIAEWFMKHHSDRVQNKRLLSWAGKLGIKLNCKGELDEDQLFHLFVLAALWNNEPTYEAGKGEQVFQTIKKDYTLEHFREAESKGEFREDLKNIAYKGIQNPNTFVLLKFIATGKTQRGNVWQEIRRVLELPGIGNKEIDINRLRQLYGIFNPREYKAKAYFTVKSFLIFRELRIQFKETGRYQYNPIVCCIPDSHVRMELTNLNLIQQAGNDIDSLIAASEMVAKYFCTNAYELYDLPLFFWHKRSKKNTEKMVSQDQAGAIRGRSAGICPSCGSPLVWRRARKTRELYRGCTNFDGGCRWKDRSY